MAKLDKNVVIVSADMGAPSLDKFRRNLPSQFVNVGIAEQNAITIAAGLTLAGKKVFAYCITPFITLRCLEQIRIQMGMMRLPITIVGIGAGLSYEKSGPTHHILEDVAIMRSLPNITINSISDSVMASCFAEISYKMKMPNYIRLERHIFPNIYDKKTDFSKGLAVLKESRDCYVVSTGCMTHLAIDITKKLNKIGVIDIYTIPIKENLFLQKIKGIKKIITLEENFLAGGLGSVVCEILSDHNIHIPVKRIGLPLTKGYCYKYGSREDLRNYYGIGRKSIEEEIREFLRIKIGCAG